MKFLKDQSKTLGGVVLTKYLLPIHFKFVALEFEKKVVS